MIEVVCPSCGARYQVPDNSIGTEGRKVTCSNCQHKWRAYPPGAADPVGAEAPASETAAGTAAGAATGAASAGATGTEPARTGPGMAAPGLTDDDAPGAGAAPEAGAEAGAGAEGNDGGAGPAGGREAQMDSIRRMLDDLKRSAESEPEIEPGSGAAAASAPSSTATPTTPRANRPERTMHRHGQENPDDAVDPDDGDPLRSRISRVGKDGRGGKETARPANYDAAKLRKLHEKRAKRLQKARERKRGSGAFVTGFTLVAVVCAAVVGLYVMQPQIVAASPELEPAMTEYVVTVDRYRLALDEATADWRAWVAERVGPLLGGEEGSQGGEQAASGEAAQ